MITGVNQSAQRLAIATLMLAMVRHMNSQDITRSEHFGSSADELLIFLAVIVGQLEGRPMTAGKLATYAGVPRATADRKLKTMVARGIVQRSYSGAFTVPLERINCPEQVEACTKVQALIRQTADRLSKMGSGSVAALMAALLL